jgi:2-iminobutanoate/2-iminopropanoate deaminase
MERIIYMNTVYTPNAPEPIGPYSQAKKAASLLFCSGQIAIDPATGAMSGKDVSEQTEQVCRNIGNVLKTAGLSFDDVVKTTCFLTDSNDFTRFNEVYAKYFTSEPARSCVFVSALPKGASVEVEAVAYKADK